MKQIPAAAMPVVEVLRRDVERSMTTLFYSLCALSITCILLYASDSAALAVIEWAACISLGCVAEYIDDSLRAEDAQEAVDSIWPAK